MPVVDGAVLQRSGVVVELDQPRKHFARIRRAARATARRPSAAISRATPPGTMTSIISRWPKQASAARKHALAQDAGIAHASARTRRRCRWRRCRRNGWPAARARPSARAGRARAVAPSTPSAASMACAKAKHRRRCCRRKCAPASFAAASSVAPRISDFDALVHIAEPLFQPHHSLAVGGETEMARLDDAGMHRADRNLMQAFALRRQERIRSPACARRCGRRADGARPRIRWSSQGRVSGAPIGIEAIQIADGAFETNRRRMPRADARIGAVLAGVAQHGDVAASFRSASAMCTAAASPQRPSSVQRPAARSSIACRQPSSSTITRGQGRCRSACSTDL